MWPDQTGMLRWPAHKDITPCLILLLFGSGPKSVFMLTKVFPS